MARARLEVRLAGAGGQGVVLAGLILAEAAARSGLSVCQFQAYGPASRGGASWTDVIISSEPVRYPKAGEVDVLVALSQEGCDASLPALRPGGLLLLDSGRVAAPARSGIECRALPIEGTADAAGARLAANLVALGALAAITGAVGEAALSDAALAHVPARWQAVNLRALKAGGRLVEAGVAG